MQALRGARFAAEDSPGHPGQAALVLQAHEALQGPTGPIVGSEWRPASGILYVSGSYRILSSHRCVVVQRWRGTEEITCSQS
jgi:hypothetical protein